MTEESMEQTVAQAIERRKKEGYANIKVNGMNAVIPKTWIDIHPYDGSMDDWIVDIEVDYDGPLSTPTICIEAHKPGEKPTREWACAKIDSAVESMIEDGADEKVWREIASRVKTRLIDQEMVKENEIGWMTRLALQWIERQPEWLEAEIRKEIKQ